MPSYRKLPGRRRLERAKMKRCLLMERHRETSLLSMDLRQRTNRFRNQWKSPLILTICSVKMRTSSAGSRWTVQRLTIPYYTIQPITYDTTYNRYYLTHNYAGTATTYGSIFILGENAGDYSDFNTVVYGHNMIDGHMFAQLHRFKEQSFFDTHDQIIIYTPDRKLTYQVFAAYRSNNLDIIANNDFSTQELREQYIKSIYTNVELGLFERDIPVTGEDRIITLSTCIWNPAYRFLVQGVLVSDEPGAFTGTQMTSENAYG